MNLDNEILELDIPCNTRWRKLLYSIALYFSLILFFTTLSSYQNPQVWINNNNQHLQSFIELQISSLVNLNYKDTTQNLNDQINELVVNFYERRNYKTAWIENIKLTD